MILRRAKEEIEQDKAKKQELIAKTLKDKEMRDAQMRMVQDQKAKKFL